MRLRGNLYYRNHLNGNAVLVVIHYILKIGNYIGEKSDPLPPPYTVFNETGNNARTQKSKIRWENLAAKQHLKLDKCQIKNPLNIHTGRQTTKD